jgi:phosphate acetyltransferase
VSFVAQLRSRAAVARRRIVFPESGDDRVLHAVRAIRELGVAEPLLVVAPGEGSGGEAARATGARCIDPLTDPRRQAVARWLLERRGSRGLTGAAAEALALEPLYFADSLVALGEADGCVAGAATTTAAVLRAALWTVGPAPGVRTVSSAFYMVVAPFRGEEEEVLTFADCAVVIEPAAEQLADIAIAAARDRRLVVGDEPRVAFLSYGTVGSGTGPSIERVRAAVEHVRQRAPEIAVDGELQGDAALVPAVATRKAPRSSVAGRANVLIFPSLDAGNIAYKLVERLAHAWSIGPIIQGLARPCSDLSRGASADDIINVAAVNALQASGAEHANTDGPRRENHQ